ncbi:MAG: hypothetical protein HQM02_06890, partial [Magnetococcales bacterium]|nr:hypothetical protein [Magnetococcales bacterium]
TGATPGEPAEQSTTGPSARRTATGATPGEPAEQSPPKAVRQEPPVSGPATTAATQPDTPAPDPELTRLIPQELAKLAPEQVKNLPSTSNPVEKTAPIQERTVTPAQAKARSTLIAAIRADLAAQGVQTEVDETGGRIFLPQGLTFAYGSAKLPDQGGKELNSLAKTLKKILPCYARSKKAARTACPQGEKAGKLDSVLIDGFAHTADMGSIRFRYNWLLATSRSLQTFVNMTQKEPELHALTNDRDQSLFRITGHASTVSRQHPKYPRRVELRFRMADP